MAQNFLACDRDQELLLPPSLRDWLPDGHLAGFVIDAVAEFDLGAFHAAYRTDGHGRPAQAGVKKSPEGVLADAGYWHQVHMERLVSDGVIVLVPPDAKKRAGARPGWDGGLYAFMRRS